MTVLQRLFDAQLVVAGHPIYWREIVGNLFGFLSALGGLRRRVWAWPVGIVGNVLLFTVFFGVALGSSQPPLFGQAARQVFFVVTSVYGWYRWNQVRQLNAHQGDVPAITPRWATARERLGIAVFWVAGVLVAQQVFAVVGAGFPAERWYYWCDAWIFVGSIVATYAMARGWNEFWLAWIAVDLVGVPLLWHSTYYPSAILYVVYSALVIYGFVVWVRASRTESPGVAPERADSPSQGVRA